MNKDEVKNMIHQWGIQRLDSMEKEHDEKRDGNIAYTRVTISALLARELGLELPANVGPTDELVVRTHWNFKERTARKYFVFWVHMPGNKEDLDPFLWGDGEFLS